MKKLVDLKALRARMVIKEAVAKRIVTEDMYDIYFLTFNNYFSYLSYTALFYPPLSTARVCGVRKRITRFKLNA